MKYRLPPFKANWGRHPNVMAAALYHARKKKRQILALLLEDGGFDDPEKWEHGIGWTVSNGKANSDGGVGKLKQLDLAIVPGKHYDVGILTSGVNTYVEGLDILLGGDIVNTITADGDFTKTVIAGGTDSDFALSVDPLNAFIGDIESVSLEEAEAPDGEPHTFWRLFVHTSVDGVSIEVAEIEFRTFINGYTTTSPTGLITASAEDYGAATQAFDRVITAGWSTLGTEQWVKYEYVSPTSIFELVIRAGTINANRGPKDFELQYSDDDISWTSYLKVFDESGWGTQGNVEKLYQISTQPAYSANAHKHWRLHITANNGDVNYTGFMRQIEFRAGGEGNTDQTERGVATASSFLGAGWEPFHSFLDNVLYWLTENGGAVPSWIAYEHTIPVEVNELMIQCDLSNRNPKDFTLQYSDDGIEWFTKTTYSGINDWVDAAERIFAV